MILAGKCPPKKNELKAAKTRGFDNVELYLERKHIDNFEESLENCRNAEVEVVSVHTPHVNLDEKEYFSKTAELARKLNSFLVVHSQHVHHVNIPEIETTNFNVKYGYENNPGISASAIENLILSRGHNLVLDTAHLYMAEENYNEALSHFVNHKTERINVIHVNDSTKLKDGLRFGEGEMNMKKTCKIVDDSNYEGIVVLEVMPDFQEEALEKWRKWTDY